MTHIGPKTAYELIWRLVSAADQYKADLMVTLCPMCQLNIDAYQGEMNRHKQTSYHMPILFFTQLIGLAFGKDPKTLGIGREIVDAGPALDRIGIELPPPEDTPEARAAKRAKKEGLPMPHMSGEQEAHE